MPQRPYDPRMARLFGKYLPTPAQLSGRLRQCPVGAAHGSIIGKGGNRAETLGKVYEVVSRRRSSCKLRAKVVQCYGLSTDDDTPRKRCFQNARLHATQMAPGIRLEFMKEVATLRNPAAFGDTSLQEYAASEVKHLTAPAPRATPATPSGRLPPAEYQSEPQVRLLHQSNSSLHRAHSAPAGPLRQRDNRQQELVSIDVPVWVYTEVHELTLTFSTFTHLCDPEWSSASVHSCCRHLARGRSRRISLQAAGDLHSTRTRVGFSRQSIRDVERRAGNVCILSETWRRSASPT